MNESIVNLFAGQSNYWGKVANNIAKAEAQQKQGQEQSGMNRHERRKAAVLARRKTHKL
jgi:hypothetical protein